MTQEIRLEVVDHVDELPKHFRRRGAVHEQLLGAEHLGHLAEEDTSTQRREAIGDAPEQGVGRDAAEAIGPAALVAEHEGGRRHRLAAVVRHARQELGNRLDTTLALVGDILRVEEPDPAPVHVTGAREQGVHLVVLAAQPEHEHAARIGVAEQPGEHGLGVREIVAELAASEWMPERVNAVDRFRRACRGRLRDALGHEVDAADGVEDPHLVAGPDAAGGAAVSVEGRHGLARRVDRTGRRIDVFLEPGESGAKIVGVHPASCGDGSARLTDDEAVLHHELVGTDRL